MAGSDGFVLMGVAGAGKTTVGKALALRLGWAFADADDFHTLASRAKMKAGIPLTDADRGPWLRMLANYLKTFLANERSIVLACSALKEDYRGTLRVTPAVRFIYLKVDAAILAERLKNRIGSFFNPLLLESQIGTLEEPRDALVIDANADVNTVLERIFQGLKEAGYSATKFA